MEPIEEVVRRHDPYQFEIKHEYSLNREKRRDLYRVETFFFIPNNLDVNASTYSKSRFYKDLLLYIRFTTPDFPIRAIIDPENSRSPLAKIGAKIGAFFHDPSRANADSLDYEIKLFGCVLKSSLRDHFRFIARIFEEEGGPGSVTRREAECFALLDEFIRGAREAADRFRGFREKLASPSIPKNLYSAYNFTDEYVSLLIEGRAHQLLRAVSAFSSKPFAEAQKRLADLIASETAYRAAMKYPTIARPDGDNEVFVFRLSVLKKFVSSILHLSVRTEEAGQGIRQLALAVGAGVAMLFATAVAFYYQKIYGTLSLYFFIALVVSYMLKDRMKAVSQNYLEKRLRAKLFDQETDIRDLFNNEKIGVCRETVGFADEKQADPLVLRLRDRDHITEIENDWRSEKILHYSKEIELFSKNLAKNQSRKTAITDIARFNIGSFLGKMDDPVSEVFYLDQGRSKTVQAARVYHVNLVVKFTSSDAVRYYRVRIVLNRQGIKRVEHVSRETLPVNGAR